MQIHSNLDYLNPQLSELRAEQNAGQSTNIGYNINMCMRSRVHGSHHLLCLCKRQLRRAKIAF